MVQVHSMRVPNRGSIVFERSFSVSSLSKASWYLLWTPKFNPDWHVRVCVPFSIYASFKKLHFEREMPINGMCWFE